MSGACILHQDVGKRKKEVRLMFEMSSWHRFSYAEETLKNRLNGWAQPDSMRGISANEEIYTCGLALMMRYGWSQKELHEKWPAFFGERSAL